MKKVILKAEQAFGPPSAKRYVIVNVKTDKAWDGQRFVANWDAGVKFATPGAACAEMQLLLKREYADLPVRKFKVPIEIEVFGTATAIQVAKWLHQASVLHLRSSEFGNGPNGTLVCCVIHWGEIEADDELDFDLNLSQEGDDANLEK